MSEPRRPGASSLHLEPGGRGADLPELPLRILVVADLTGRDEVIGPRAVSKDSYGELLERLAPAVVDEVPDHLTGGPRPLPVTLEFRSLRAFEPAAVARAVPALRELLEARAALEAARGGAPGPEVLAALAGSPVLARLGVTPPVQGPAARPAAPAPAAPARAPAGPAPAGVGRILDMVDVPGAPAGHGAAASTVDALVQAIGAARSGAVPDRAGVQRALAEVDRVLGMQLAPVLALPALTALESRWRGLRFLVDRIDFRAPIRLAVASAPAGRAAALLEAQADESDAPALVLAAYDLGPSGADAELAEALARAGEALQAPVIVGLAPRFLGLEAWADAGRLPALAQVLERPEYLPWRALRGKDAAYWLGLTVGRFLVRRPWAASAESPYAESAPGAGAWTSPVWAVGAAIARSIARGGIGLDVTGAAGSGLVDDLPLPDAERGTPALEPPLTAERAAGIAGNGLLAFAAHAPDAICLAAAPVVRQPPHYGDETANFVAAQQATLPHSLLAGRLAALLGELRGRLTGLGDDAVQSLVARQLEAFLGPGAAAAAALKPDPDRAGRSILHVRVRPPGTVLGRPIEITLGVGLTR